MPDRFAEVMDGLYRGGAPQPDELAALKDLWGVSKIVSLDDEVGHEIKPICDSLGLNQIIWGLGDGTDPKVTALKKRIVPALLRGGPTYVHCRHGKDRTGMTIAMFRVYNGWPVVEALTEAHKFGMGSGLSRATRHSYYDAVRQFAKELENDKNNAMDAVTLTRRTNPFGPGGSVLPQSFMPPHADIEFSPLSRLAFGRLYCKCKPNALLKPTYWWGSKKAAVAHSPDDKGTLYSAAIISSAKLERFEKPVSQKILYEILSRKEENSIDVAAFRNEQYFVIDPDILIDIHEEDDVGNVVEVGMRDNSTDYTFAYPGSSPGIGGMPIGDGGVPVGSGISDGAAGFPTPQLGR